MAADALRFVDRILELLGLNGRKPALCANLPKVVQEFREKRRIQALRVLVHGNDDLAISEVAVKLAAEYKVPHVKAADAVAAAREGEGELATELQKTEVDATPPELVAKVLSAALSTPQCRNQGYFLEGFPANKEQALLLFPAQPAGEGEGEEGGDPPAEEEGEERAEKKGAPSAAAPEFVFVLEADEEAIKAKLLAMPELKTTEEQLAKKLDEYKKDNEDDSPTSILMVPSIQSVEPIALAVTEDLEPLLTKARNALQRPRNFGPTEQELAAAKALADAEEATAKAKEAELAAQREATEREERERREALEARRLAELQQQERELLEVRSIPLRTYLMQHVIPTLTEGLIEVCKLKPDDPIDHLAEWLFKNNPVDDDHFH